MVGYNCQLNQVGLVFCSTVRLLPPGIFMSLKIQSGKQGSRRSAEPAVSKAALFHGSRA